MRNTGFVLLIFLCVFGGMERAGAQVTLNQAVSCALDNHPQLKVARTDVALAQARLIDAGKLENPVFEFNLQSLVGGDGPDREGAVFMGYSQKFPITAKLLRERDLGIAEVRLACAEVLEAERNFINKVQLAYIKAAGQLALIGQLRRVEEATAK